ncbi:MAG: BTB/POZ domain-containing protein KCTD2 [Candidatus Accumulibacter sp.]|jgi:hypothetical protein|nr:BTB/POZ domain-containing protein KCTD2 [Accumulibacter sp.]
MKKAFPLGVVIFLGSIGLAHAACTVEEAQTKAQAFQQAVVTAAQKDPQKYQQAVTAMQKDLPALQSASDMDALCKFYDDWTKKLK